MRRRLLSYRPYPFSGTFNSIFVSSAKSSIIWIVVVLSLTFMIGRISGQVAITGTVSDADDLVHHGDILDIDIVGSFEFDWRGGITPEGFLNGYDRIAEPIFALCKSESQVADSIAEQLGKILRQPVVIVRIIDRTKRPIGILTGAIKTPQRFRVLRDVSLRELLILSGGVGDNAGGGIQIFRSRDASCSEGPDASRDDSPGTTADFSQTMNIRIADLLAGAEGANPKILSGDIITVFETLPVYVVGGVRNPGQLEYRDNLTLSRSIAAAGGIVKNAADGKIVIHRREGAATTVIEADLRKISAGQREDPKLQAYDVIEVREKGRGSRRQQTRIDTPVVATEAARRLPLRVID